MEFKLDEENWKFRKRNRMIPVNRAAIAHVRHIIARGIKVKELEIASIHMLMIYTRMLAISACTPSTPPIPIKSRWLPSTLPSRAPHSLTDSCCSLDAPLLPLADLRMLRATRTQLIRIILIRFRRLASILKSFDKHITITSVCIPVLCVAGSQCVRRASLVANLHSVGCRRSAHALNGRGRRRRRRGRTEGRARGATKEKPAGPS